MIITLQMIHFMAVQWNRIAHQTWSDAKEMKSTMKHLIRELPKRLFLHSASFRYTLLNAKYLQDFQNFPLPAPHLPPAGMGKPLQVFSPQGCLYCDPYVRRLLVISSCYFISIWKPFMMCPFDAASIVLTENCSIMHYFPMVYSNNPSF